MKHIRHYLTIAALSVTLPAFAEDKSAPRTEAAGPASELDKLQGSWEGTEAGRDAEGKCTLTITGNALRFQGSNKGEWYQATFEIPAGTNPAQLQGTIKDCPAKDFIGKVSLAIFKIEDGTLTLVGHAPGDPNAPKGFDGDATARTFVFKKAAPGNGNAAPPR
ncbi:MAG: hypothetical protein ABIZ56_08330 [Chthoniobacteraceae bacterium]